MSDTKHHTKGLNFGGFSGYYGYMSAHNGYGGFNYLDDVEYMNKSMWTASGAYGYQTGWCDSGFQNLAAAAKANSLGWIYDYGVMETASSHTFTIESFMDTASWSKDASWEINSYTESKGQLIEKGSMTFTPTFSKAETVKLQGANWTGIAAVAFELLSLGQGGNTCTYGTAAYGYQMCIDQLKAKFSKKADLKHNTGNLLTPYELKHHQTNAAHVAATSHMAHVDPSHEANASHGAQHTDAGYHSQLLSLGHDSGITSQFHLPAAEHFA